MPKNRILMLMVMGTIIFFYGCGAPPSPIDEIRSALKGVPTYSVILEDMTVEGNFFKDYYHKYRVIVEDQTTVTGWRKASEKFYQQYEPFLGMTVWSKKDGKESGSAGPPGYEYVGDSRYGKWQSDSSGRSFWVRFIVTTTVHTSSLAQSGSPTTCPAMNTVPGGLSRKNRNRIFTHGECKESRVRDPLFRTG